MKTRRRNPLTNVAGDVLPEGVPGLGAYHRKAVKAVEACLAERGMPYERLADPSTVLHDVKRKFSVVWQTEISADGWVQGIWLCVDGRLPFSKPDVFLCDKSLFLKIPHVERTRRLCVIPSHGTFAPSDPAGVTSAVLDDARQLLIDGLSGHNQSDFLDEFESYWVASAENASSAIALIDPVAPSREIHFWRLGDCLLFAENADVAQTWLERVHIEETVKKGRTGRTVMLWHDEAPIPDQYPRTNSEVARLAEAGGTAVLEALFSGVRDSRGRSTPVLFCCGTKNGPGLAAVDLTAPLEPTGKGKTRPVKLSHGFRSIEKMPNELLGQRYLTGAGKVVRRGVDRVDPEWILNRGGDGFGKLFDKHVCVIGCGAIGASVAWQLAQAGLGQLTLVDQDTYSWDNAARHILPGTEVGRNKAKAVATHIMRQMPQVHVEACETRWEDVWSREEGTVSDADLIISCMGVWESELALNVLKRTGLLQMPLLFVWAEAQALAGHSLLVSGTGGCLACGMSPTGVFDKRAIKLPEEQMMVRAPACGGFFQPYGIVGISAVRRMATEHAVHTLLGKAQTSNLRSWVASEDALAGRDGALRAEFCSFLGEDVCCDRVMRAEWPADEKCHLCKKG